MRMMSRQTIAVAWAIQARGLSHGAWRALVVLAHHVSHRRNDWDVWPKQKTLADICEMPLSTLKRHLDELETEKLIVRRKRYRNDGGFAGCTYSLNVIASFTVGNDHFEFGPDDEAEDDPLAQIGLGGGSPPVGYPLAELRATPQPASELARTSGIEHQDSNKGDLFGNPIEPERVDDDAAAVMFTDRWNAMAERVDRIMAITRLGDKRRASLLARIDEYERARDLERVAALIDRVIATIEGSRFCRGEVKSFKASAEWALTPTWFPKLEETGYVQDAADDYRAPVQPGERNHVTAGLAARDILHASGRTARRSARELAGGAPRGAPRRDLGGR